MNASNLQSAADIIGDLAFLHHVVHLNALDHAFAADHGKIDYFIDTNILRFALDPSQSVSEGRYPLALFEQGAKVAEMALMPAGFEVAEYLFRGSLPGQAGNEARLFISDAHGMEVDRFQEDLYSGGPSSDAETLRALVAGYGAELEAKSAHGFTEAELIELAESASHLVEEMFAGSLQLLAAFDRLRKRWVHGRVHANYAKAKDAVSDAEIEEWSVRVACGYESVRFRSVDEERYRLAGVRPWRRQLLKNDARTLLEVQRLNQMAEPGARVVFVSSSRGLHRAYRDWFIASGPKSQGEDAYILRHPLQYLPLINLLAYAKIFRKDEPEPARLQIFEDIKATLDGFLDPRGGRPNFLRVLAMLHRIDNKGHWHHHQDLNAIKAQIEWLDVEEAAVEFGEHWRLAYANAALMALPAIKLRHDEHLAILSNAVKKAGGNHLAAQQIIVANIEADHVSALLWALGHEAAREHGKLPAELRDHDVVRVLPILIPFDNQDPDAPDIVKALKGTVTEAVEIVRQFSVADAAQDLSPNRLLAGVCLSLALAEYDTAKRLSARWALGDLEQLPARGLDIPRDEIQSEFRYLYGLSVRFDCLSEQEFQAAMTQLKASAKGSTPNNESGVRQARSLVELGTLKLAAALRELTKEKTGSSEIWPHLVGELQGSARKFLVDACDDFFNAKVQLGAHKGESETRDRLRLQAAVNILCCFNLTHIAGAMTAKLSTLAEWAYAIVGKTETKVNLKWISTLNIDGYELLRGVSEVFPGPRSRPFVELYSDFERLQQFELTRRFIARSDRDILKLYKAVFSTS